MTQIVPISSLDTDTLVGPSDQFVINKLVNNVFQTQIILPGDLGPDLAEYTKISDISDVSNLSLIHI